MACPIPQGAITKVGRFRRGVGLHCVAENVPHFAFWYMTLTNVKRFANCGRNVSEKVSKGKCLIFSPRYN